MTPKWSRRVGFGKEIEWPVGIGGKGGGDGAYGIIKSVVGSIGYAELGYAQQNRLQLAAIRNRRGDFVIPSSESVTVAISNSMKSLKRDIRASIANARGAKSYPICGLTYLIIYREQESKDKKKEIARFVNWMMQSGQYYIKPLSFAYAPLPKKLIEINKRTLLRIR